MKNYVDKDKLQEYSTKLTAKYKTIFATKNEVGSPLIASTVAEMTDTTRVYVYAGSESGYTNGNWYYYDGSAWVSGGIYNSTAFETDKTLSIEGAAADAKAVGDTLGTKANTDGYYEEMSVGNAEQIISSVMVEDQEPYVYRTSGGSADIGNRLYEKIVGGTVAWNQLVQNGNFESASGWAMIRGSISVANNKCTFTSGAEPAVSSGLYRNDIRFLPHKYITSFYVTASRDTTIGIYLGGRGFTIKPVIAGVRTFCAIVGNSPASADTFNIYVNYTNTLQEGDTVVIEKVNLFDLTQMFGSTIADYIYSLETATAGAGVAWFKNLFPKDYYAYNAGELMSVKAAAHKTIGFNQFDKNNGDEQIFLLAGNEYQVTPYTFAQGTGSVALSLVDGDYTCAIANDGTFTPNITGLYDVFFGLGQTAAETCIHLTWSGYRNGEFEEYKEHIYPLDTSLELRGIPKLDTANELYYDGDTYESDGTVTRRYGIVDLGSLTDWGMSTIDGQNRFSSSTLHSLVRASSSNLICAKYLISPNHTSNFIGDDLIVTSGTGSSARVWIWDNSYTSTADFKNAMSGVYLVYELAEPTTEEAEPFQSPQVVDDFGTEEYVDYGVEQGTRDVSIPVGHDSQYPANLRDKLQRLPNLPSANGDYIVRYADRQASFIPLEDKYPSPPTTDGTYRLVCTVANGTVTYSWEENT